jgi:hypothetical protein
MFKFKKSTYLLIGAIIIAIAIVIALGVTKKSEPSSQQAVAPSNWSRPIRPRRPGDTREKVVRIKPKEPIVVPTCQSEVGANCGFAPCCDPLKCVGGRCLKCDDKARVNQTCNVCTIMSLPMEAGGNPQDLAECNKCGNCEGVFYNIM